MFKADLQLGASKKGMDVKTDKKETVLIVDDDPVIVDVVSAVLAKEGFKVASASNGLEGLSIAKEKKPSIIVLDIQMPHMNGYETCRHLKSDNGTKNIPVVLFTSTTDRLSRIKGLEMGADDFLYKPVDSLELVVRINNLLKGKKYQDCLESHYKVLEIHVEEKTRQLQNALLDTMRRLTLTAEYRDEDSFDHIKRIGFYTEIIVKELGIPPHEADVMVHASPMHDIGMVGVPDAILRKPGELTLQEFEIVKTHTTIGARILSKSQNSFLESARKFALYHHECWDGSGYPQGLKGKEIPIEGRIMGIIDRYDTLRIKRSYKLPCDHETAVSVITKGNSKTDPSHFDPEILNIFNANSERFREIFETFRLEIENWTH